ncbi:MAG: SLAC1 anion channel family protein [Ichthyobacteriaceae bacterium]|nr:SLAC1 anion channel family protein [Ichthyobacteriaceae bacterium]
MKKRVQHFPIAGFSSVMGMAGVSAALNKFYHLQWFPEWPYLIVMALTVLTFVVSVYLYSEKAYRFPEEVKTDFKHRIRINFFSAITISFLLMAIMFYGIWPMVSLPLWWIGFIGHTYIMLHTIRFWIQHNFEIKTFNPAWFIPVVGNMLIPVIGVDFIPRELALVYFGIGFLFWIILLTIFMNRVVFHDQLPKKFLPTFFILLAPPAVGFASYVKITQSLDTFAFFMLYIAYFFAALLLMLFKSFKNLKFFVSWWAFLFPLASVTLSSVAAYQLTSHTIYMYLAWFFMTLSIVALFVVGAKTLGAIKRKELCVEED